MSRALLTMRVAHMGDADGTAVAGALDGLEVTTGRFVGNAVANGCGAGVVGESARASHAPVVASTTA